MAVADDQDSMSAGERSPVFLHNGPLLENYYILIRSAFQSGCCTL